MNLTAYLTEYSNYYFSACSVYKKAYDYKINLNLVVKIIFDFFFENFIEF